jgi:hypothetical protein
MKLVFIDETGDKKFKDYLGLCIATIDARSYPLLKRESLKILEETGWDTETEFKGSFLFSATKGSSGVEVQERVDAAHRLLDLNTSDQKSRLKFAYGKMSSTNKGADYLAGVPQLLQIRRVLPRASKGAGKNLISVTCDDRDDVKEDDLHRAIKPVLEEKGYIVLERVHQARSAPDAVGLMFADLVAYLVGRADTISNDAEFFEGLDQEQLKRSSKVRKLRSSTDLLKKIKRLDLYIKKQT